MDELQAIESFHLALLTAMSEYAGRNDFVLKGGTNLRFFYQSVRYSEDVDIDVPAMQPWRFSEKIGRTFESDLLRRLTALLGTNVTQAYRKEHTDTKEKWAVQLTRPELDDPIWTRLEISYREYPYPPEAYRIERVPESVVAPYAPVLRPPLIQRYLPATTIGQKTRALGGRRETQPRDVFDLDLLFRGWRERPNDLSRDEIDVAITRVYEIGYEEYLSKVVIFLDPALAGTYRETAVWGSLQQRVLDSLLELLT